MSFLKGLVNIIEVIDRATNEESEVVRDGRRFKILVEGRFHNPAEPWVYDVTATDTRTGTSKKVKHFQRKEDGVAEAVRAVLGVLAGQGRLESVDDETPTPVAHHQGNPPNDHVTNSLLKTLAKKGYLPDPVTSSPPSSDIKHRPAPCSSKTTPENFSTPGPESYIEPDLDGLYTNNAISPAEPVPAQLDPSTTYVTWQSPKKGLAFILNNNEFPHFAENMKMRRGSEIDLQNAVHIFSQLGYEPLVHRNLTRNEILTSLDALVQRINAEGSSHSSVCLVLMSHGNQLGICGTDGCWQDLRIVSRDEIKGKLSGRRCKALLGKPKLIFIQACRGNTFTRNADELDAAMSPRNPGGEPTTPPPFETDFMPDPKPDLALDINASDDPNDFDVDAGGELPNNADIFVANATSNGYFSIRMRHEGSWFIQALAEVFLAHAHSDELNELMRKVTCLVTERYRTRWCEQPASRTFEVRQTPAYESQGMRKRFFFLPKYPAQN